MARQAGRAVNFEDGELSRVSKLKSHHIGYLASKETLTKWAHLSLVQRCRMLHRAFPEIKISPSTLSRVYAAHKIRFKQIRRVKPPLDLLSGKPREQALQMLRDLRYAQSRNLKIVFVDEAVFTFNTFQGKAWAPVGENIEVSEKSLSMPTWAIVTGVSTERGIELSITHKRSVATPQFVDFLEQLS